MDHAYTSLQIKSVQDTGGKRIFTGVATTPTTDRAGDIVEPKGAVVSLPIPLLWQHNANDPIGWVTAATVKDTGIEIVGEVATIYEPGTLKDRLDQAWQMIKGKLVQGLSIGFNSLESTRIENTGSYRYLKWRWLELSAVTIPANGDCSINAIKSADRAIRRALSATASTSRGNNMAKTALLSVSSNFELTLDLDGSKPVGLGLSRIQAQRLADELHSFAANRKSTDGRRQVTFPMAILEDLPAGRQATKAVSLNSGTRKPDVVYLKTSTTGNKRPVIRLK